MNPLLAALFDFVAAEAKAEIEKSPEDIARDVIDVINEFAPTAFAQYLTAKDAAAVDASVDIVEAAKLAVKASGG